MCGSCYISCIQGWSSHTVRGHWYKFLAHYTLFHLFSIKKDALLSSVFFYGKRGEPWYQRSLRCYFSEFPWRNMLFQRIYMKKYAISANLHEKIRFFGSLAMENTLFWLSDHGKILEWVHSIVYFFEFSSVIGRVTP